ncbi:hypothetical protein [Curvibacter sp. PAE-UM]|uniref:hypothetical protein n=1 Tax=Curvibacter sp. PAE-UM TaxID=1714344 RepID=UPI0007093273|nr:hypothetical protein [Curvibacter sp. PAE-UM]KRH99742.1 hypothetical protein AO057_16925 [Curvibacter sp. PAE-UM]
MKSIAVFIAACALSVSALAKLPAPNDEAKAKAAEAAAKTAHAGKVDGYKLCKSQDKVAAQYRKSGKAGKDAKPVATAPCADPGPFVYKPATAAAPAAPAAAPAKKS